MNRLQGMELFVEVARTLSFGRAAENLAIPKSTLSRQVAELERSVGLRLLSRTTRRVELTEAGQLYSSAASASWPKPASPMKSCRTWSRRRPVRCA